MDPVNVLLVDDEPRNLDALEAILSDQGYNLIRAEDADLALRLLLEHDVAAMILDIQMPRMNGIELARIIKGTKRYREIPILFLTAHMLDDQDILSGYGAGAVDYLTKPFNAQVLKYKVAVFAELFRKTRALAELNEQLEERVKERTADLEKSEAALRAAARQKDEFLAVLAHELRNPLAPIRTGIDLLVRAQPAPSQGSSRTLAAMNRQVEHLVRLIDDLLDVSRISTGTLELKRERTNLAMVVESAVETFHGLFQQRRIEVTVASKPTHAFVDPVRVAQIIGNVLHNASKYTLEGGKVNIELAQEGAVAAVRVRDNGLGIPPDQLGRVFDMFTRVQRSAPSTVGGAGIGLALAKRLALMHGGDLVATSEGEGHGTLFTLTLPASVAAASEAPPKTPAASAEAAGLDIVVVEDNPDIADMIVVWLEQLGHRAQLARDGASGVELILTTKPTVVLCDIGLPDFDGVEVCRRVREKAGASAPTMIAVTGWGKDEDRRRTREAGFAHHLVKPVPLEELAVLLDAIPRTAPQL